MIDLMTIGYEGLAPAEFFGILERCRVGMVVDVRELPISRKPGFSKTALAAALVSRDMTYQHVVELGCPRDVRHAYRADGDWARYTRHFKAYLETQTEALQQVAEWAESERCCLLCYEADYNFCHRSYVAESVAAMAIREVRILHLTGPVTGRVVRRELVPA